MRENRQQFRSLITTTHRADQFIEPSIEAFDIRNPLGADIHKVPRIIGLAEEPRRGPGIPRTHQEQVA